MAKSLFVFIENKRGSLVGALVAFGLLGISISGLITYVQHFSKTATDTAEQINFNPQFLGTVLGNMKSLLIDAEKNSSTHFSENGICDLVNPISSKLKKNVEQVTLDVSKLAPGGSTNLRWNTFFPTAVGWTPAPTGELNPGGKCDEIAGSQVAFADSNLMKCYKYTGDTERSNEIYVVAQIIPKIFPSNALALTNTNLAANNAVFHLKASIGVIPFQDGSGVSTVAYVNTRSDILWANSAGSCAVKQSCSADSDCSVGATSTCVSNVCSLPAVVKLSVSGMMGSGDDGTLNAKLNNNQDNCAGLVIGDLKPYATQGTKDLTQSVGGEKWAVKDDDVSSRIYMACVMKKFRCQNHTLTQTTDMDTFFDDGMHFTFQLDNNTGRPVVIEKMDPTIQGPGVNEHPAIAVYSLAPDHPFKVIEASGTNDGKFEKITGITYSDNSLFQEELPPSTRLTLRIPPGGGQFKVIFKGNNTACNSPPSNYCAVYEVCDGVCHESAPENWRPKVQITANDPKLGTCTRIRDYTNTNEKVECISCFAKSCHRLGMGTVGKRGEIQQEALDSQLPECKAAGAGSNHETERKIASSNTFKDSNNNIDANATGDCIALNLDTNTDGNLDDSDSDGELDIEEDFKGSTFQQQTCATAYPVLCYANGRYQPATVWDATMNSNQGGYKLKEVGYADAQEACYEMGKEVLDKSRLEEYMTAASGQNFDSTNMGCSGANCEFVNNATRGMFFLPTYDIGTVFNKGLLTGKTFMWVAAELDQGGLVVATPLQASLGSVGDYALFNRKEHGDNYDPVLLKETGSLVGAISDPYALVYSVKYKGLAKRTKTSVLRFVCQKDAAGGAVFFLTSTTASFCNGSTLNGAEKCAGASGYFVAPESALDYSRAMMLLKNADPTAETTVEYAVPVDNNLGTYNASTQIHTKNIDNSVQAWVAVGTGVTCP